MAVTKIASSDPAVVNHQLTYAITVANTGAAPATSVTLTDILPANVEFITSSSGCPQSSGEVVCDLGALAAGGAATVNIIVKPQRAGTITNAASVSCAEGSTASTELSFPVLSPTLTVTQTTSLGTAVVYRELAYTITVTNAGDASGTGDSNQIMLKYLNTTLKIVIMVSSSSLNGKYVPLDHLSINPW